MKTQFLAQKHFENTLDAMDRAHAAFDNAVVVYQENGKKRADVERMDNRSIESRGVFNAMMVAKFYTTRLLEGKA